MAIPKTVVIVAGSYTEQAAKLTLNSVQSYLKMQNVSPATNEQEKLYTEQYAKRPFYGKIVPAAPDLMQFILESDIESDEQAQALNLAYKNHVLDPEFIDVLMQYLAQPQCTPASRAAVGAYLTTLLNDLLNEKEKKIVEIPVQQTEKNKETKQTETKTTIVKKEVMDDKYKPDALKYISDAITQLLGATANLIQSEYPTLNDREALGVAAAVCMANAYSISAIVELNLAVTAKIFDLLDNAGQNKIIIAALELKKDDFTKLAGNQQAFIDSLKRWIYGKLNFLDTSSCYEFLTHVYGIKPTDLSSRLIYIKDCGTQYVNLLQVSKHIEA